MASSQWTYIRCLCVGLLCVLSVAPTCMAKDYYFDWTIQIVNYTRNCVTKPLLTVNGLFPGPLIEVEEGDHVVVKVTNDGNVNVTIHWHGIRQIKSNWADGVAYITECPIQPGNSEIYDFHVVEQRGTTFWHAHITWVRATVYGAFTTLPKDKAYPFPKPDEEVSLILGEWWNTDVEVIYTTGLAQGGAFPLADALTINGYPGPTYNCSATEGMTVVDVTPGKTYLLRLVNAALNSEMFFSIAKHILTVVEVDSMYVKPFTVGDKGIVIAPGQTTSVLVTADQTPGTYYMVGNPHSTVLVTDTSGVPASAIQFIKEDDPTTPTSGLFQYKHCPSNTTYFPALAAYNDTVYSFDYASRLKILHPELVPTSDTIRHLFYTVGTGTEPCTTQEPCAPSQGAYRVTGQVNNISFVSPDTAILPAYYYDIPDVYTPNFPDYPPGFYDFTAPGSPPSQDQVAKKATRVSVLEYGSVIELVLQDVNNFAFEAHPFHLHGTFFFVLGQGHGNFDPSSDPAKFNYYDPPSRFTVNVPTRGWVAFRFKAENPGVWLMHCHLEKHLSWGMEVVFIVKDGNGTGQSLPGPNQKINQC